MHLGTVLDQVEVDRQPDRYAAGMEYLEHGKKGVKR
jgi:hypothetical protein